MFNFEGMIRRSVEAAGCEGAVIAFPYDRPRRASELMFDEMRIAGFIADDEADARESTHCVGWWSDRARGDMRFTSRLSSPLLIIGAQDGSRLPKLTLAAARMFGACRRVIVTDCSGEVIEDLDISNPASILVDKRAWRQRGIDFESALDDTLPHFNALVGDSDQRFVPDRILHFIGSLAAGGAERQAAFLARESARRGKDVHVLCLSLDPPTDFFRPDLEVAGVRVSAISAVATGDLVERMKPFLAAVNSKYNALGLDAVFAEAGQCAAAVRAIAPGVVHLWMDHFNTIGAIASIAAGAPKIIMSGRSYAPTHFQFFQPWMRTIYRRVLAHPNIHFLNNSDGGARDYEKWLGLSEGEISVVHNGFERPTEVTPQQRAALRRELQFGPGDIVAGSMIRFSEEKRPEFLVDVARHALTRNPDLRFAFFGNGPMREALKAQILAAGLNDRIVLPGATNKPLQAIAAMDVFLLASRIEGLPNVLVEAQLMGVPIVCTGTGGMSETFVEGETGISASSTDANLFADMLVTLLRDPERRNRMSAAAREFAASHFSMDRMVDQTLRGYGGAYEGGT